MQSLHSKLHEDREWGQSYNSTISLILALDGVGVQRHDSAVLLHE